MFPIEIFLIIFFLFLSGFFSGSENALLSLDRLSLGRIGRLSPPRSRVLKRLLKNLHSTLITILLGNILVNVAISSISTNIFVKYWEKAGLVISIILVTSGILIFGEITPKLIALKIPQRFSLSSSRVLLIFYYLFLPLRVVLKELTDFFLRGFSKDLIHRPLLTEEELSTILDIGEKEGAVDFREKNLIRAVMEFQDTEVSQIMTPRIDIHAVPIDIKQENLLQFLKKVRHSKVPVYEENLDKIIGIIYAKEIFLKPQEDFRSLIKNPVFVPETKKIVDLLRDFYTHKEALAVVVDEYGGTAGIVTLEDILEEIFGEIYDEFEAPRENIRLLGKDRWMVSGRASIKDINQDLGLELPEEEFDTIAGFVLDILGKIPQAGEKIRYRNLEITVERSTKKRIISLVLRKL